MKLNDILQALYDEYEEFDVTGAHGYLVCKAHKQGVTVVQRWRAISQNEYAVFDIENLSAVEVGSLVQELKAKGLSKATIVKLLDVPRYIL